MTDEEPADGDREIVEGTGTDAMKIIHRYVLAEIWRPYVVALFAFTLATTLNRFARLSDLVIARGVPAALVGKLLFSLLPLFLEITLPAALLLAVLLALGRLGADSETTALSSAGVGMRGLLPPVLLLATATFLASLVIAWSGLPWGQRMLADTVARIVSVRAGAGVEEHAFREVAPDVLLFPDRVSAGGDEMSGVLLVQRLEGKEPLLVFAKKGKFVPEEKTRRARLILSDGTIHNDDRAEHAYRIASFREMEFRVGRGRAAGGDHNGARDLTLPQLARRMSAGGGAGRAASYRYHFHRRLSLAVSCLAFGLLAIPLGHAQRMRGKSPAIALTLIIILLYYIFIAAAGVFESTSPVLMAVLMWFPNAAGFAAACWLLWRSEHRLILLPSPFGPRSGGK